MLSTPVFHGHWRAEALLALGTAAPGQLDSPLLLSCISAGAPHCRVAALGCTHGPLPFPTAQQHQGPHWPHTAMILWSDTWGLLWGCTRPLRVMGIAEVCSCDTGELLRVVQSVCLSGFWRVEEKGVGCDQYCKAEKSGKNKPLLSLETLMEDTGLHKCHFQNTRVYLFMCHFPQKSF